MEIYRRGAKRYRGSTPLVNVNLFHHGDRESWRLEDNVHWNSSAKEITIYVRDVPFRDDRTTHNYSICLSLHDVSALVSILGHTASASDASLLREHLKKQVPALVKLLACATGLIPTPMPEATPTDGE